MLLSVESRRNWVSVCNHFDERTAEGEIPAYRISKNAALPPRTNPANPFVQVVVEDRTATRRATAGNCRRRATTYSPRSVKRGRNFHGSSRRNV